MGLRATLAVGFSLVVLGACSSASAAGLIASTGACPAQDRVDAPAAAQEEAMLCMTNYARTRAGLAALGVSAPLSESAADKSRDILDCNSFSHYACGREFTYWMRATGYLSSPCWQAGENLAWGDGEYGTVGSIFRAWMRSPEHRANILDGGFTQIGINLQVGELGGRSGIDVWTQHFGSQCNAA
jgi:uncharacterized protein YkwD